MAKPTIIEVGVFIEGFDDDLTEGDDLDCTWCGGTGKQDNDDPLWYGDVAEVPCTACRGTGQRKNQTIF